MVCLQPMETIIVIIIIINYLYRIALYILIKLSPRIQNTLVHFLVTLMHRLRNWQKCAEHWFQTTDLRNKIPGVCIPCCVIYPLRSSLSSTWSWPWKDRLRVTRAWNSLEWHWQRFSRFHVPSRRVLSLLCRWLGVYSNPAMSRR